MGKIESIGEPKTYNGKDYVKAILRHEKTYKDTTYIDLMPIGLSGNDVLTIQSLGVGAFILVVGYLSGKEYKDKETNEMKRFPMELSVNQIFELPEPF